MGACNIVRARRTMTRYFICTVPETVTVTCVLPPSSCIGGAASALALMAIAFMAYGRGMTGAFVPTCT